MSEKKVGPRIQLPNNQTGVVQGRDQRSQRAEKGKAPTIQRADAEAAVRSLDTQALYQQSVRGKKSPLSDVVMDGLNALARAQGYTTPTGPLQVLVSALGPQEPLDSALGDDVRKGLVRRFVSTGFDRETSVRLVDLLAFVTAGLQTDASMKKSSRETRIKHEIEHVREQIVDLMKLTTPAQRHAAIRGVHKELLGKAAQLSERIKDLPKKELPEQLAAPENRIRAAIEIVGIIADHATGGPAQLA